jgi:hypothetical protein
MEFLVIASVMIFFAVLFWAAMKLHKKAIADNTLN